MSKIIPSLEAKKLISEAFIEQDVKYWHICDKVLRLPTPAQALAITSAFVPYIFKPEISDCDNSSLLLAARFVAEGLSIAMIDVEQLDYGINHPHYRHQLCATLLATDPIKVMCIEPSTSSMFEPNDLLRLKFVDLRT